jgi:hypothetical protein
MKKYVLFLVLNIGIIGLNAQNVAIKENFIAP